MEGGQKQHMMRTPESCGGAGKEQNVNQRLHDARDAPFLACTGPDGKRRQGSQNWRPPGTGLVL